MPVLRPYKTPEMQFEELAAMLSGHLGQQSADHYAEINGAQGWNGVVVTAVCKQAARAIPYVYDDSIAPGAKELRKSLRAQYGWNWRQYQESGSMPIIGQPLEKSSGGASRREHQGELVAIDHPLRELLQQPNNWQSLASFLWERVQQLRYHGICLVWNRPNASGRTVQRIVVPMAIATPIPPGWRGGFKKGGIRVRPSAYFQNYQSHLPPEGFSPITRLGVQEIPYERLSVVQYPHTFLRSDGLGPTRMISKSIDAMSVIEDQRMEFLGAGPNGKLIFRTDETDPKKIQEAEDRLNKNLGPAAGKTVTVISSAAGEMVVSKTADEMGWDTAWEQNQRLIRAAHQVSRSSLGDQDDMTFGGIAASLWSSNVLSIQPDMDLIGDEDTKDLGPQYPGKLSVEYEVPPIENPEQEDARLKDDVEAGAITMKEYRIRRNLPIFGDARDDLMMSKDGPIPVSNLITPPQPVGASSPGFGPGTMRASGGQPSAEAKPSSAEEMTFDWSNLFGGSAAKQQKQVAKSMLGTDRKAPLICFELDGTICRSGSGEKLGPLNRSFLKQVIQPAKLAGYRIGVVSSRPQEQVEEALGPSRVIFDIADSMNDCCAIYDRLSHGIDSEEDCCDSDLRALVECLPECDEADRLRDCIPSPDANTERESEYGWIGIPMPESIASEVQRIAASIRPEHLAAGGVETEPHVTLVYGLVTDDVQSVAQSVSRMARPMIELGSIGVFPEGPQGVPLRFDVQSKLLCEMHGKICELFPVVLTHPNYVPHVTIAYVRPEFAHLYCGPSSLSGKAVECTSAMVRLVGKPACSVPLRSVGPVETDAKWDGRLEALQARQGMLLEKSYNGQTFNRLKEIAGLRTKKRPKKVTKNRNEMSPGLEELTTLVKSLADQMVQLSHGTPTNASGGKFELVAAGLAVMAQDTGRILMLQRAISENDPASGMWEFPGGHIEQGEDPLMAASREWSEETGQQLPPGRLIAFWQSGIYRGHVWVIPSEDMVRINAKHGERAVLNPDDPDGDCIEVVAWWDWLHLIDNPAMRQELKSDIGVVLEAVGKGTRFCTEQRSQATTELDEALPELEKSAGAETKDYAGLWDRMKSSLEDESGLFEAAIDSTGKKLLVNVGDWLGSDDMDRLKAIATELGLEFEGEAEIRSLEECYPGCTILK